jgi:hypothetical protein
MNLLGARVPAGEVGQAAVDLLLHHAAILRIDAGARSNLTFSGGRAILSLYADNVVRSPS